MGVNNPYILPEMEFVGGGTQDCFFHTYFFKNKRPFDLDGCVANFAVVNHLNRGGTPIISKEMTIMGEDGGSTDDVPNILRVTLEPDDTVELAGKYIYQITVKDARGESDPPMQGIMYIHNNIDRQFARR